MVTLLCVIVPDIGINSYRPENRPIEAHCVTLPVAMVVTVVESVVMLTSESVDE